MQVQGPHEARLQADESVRKSPWLNPDVGRITSWLPNEKVGKAN
jgi:hypothetical protein